MKIKNKINKIRNSPVSLHFSSVKSVKKSSECPIRGGVRPRNKETKNLDEKKTKKKKKMYLYFPSHIRSSLVTLVIPEKRN